MRKAKAPVISRGLETGTETRFAKHFYDSSRRNFVKLVLNKSSDSKRRARESNPVADETTRQFGKPRPVPTGNTS